MAAVELIMPKMGESIMEATILKWVKNVGDSIELDETIVEIATDKVDSEIPSPVAGVLTEIFFKEDDVVDVGTAIAMIETDGDVKSSGPSAKKKPAAARTSNGRDAANSGKVVPPAPTPGPAKVVTSAAPTAPQDMPRIGTESGRFYSPLVRSIATSEGITSQELDTMPGTGLKGRVTKKDILAYIELRTPGTLTSTVKSPARQKIQRSATGQMTTLPSGNVEIVEMDRMRKLIAGHMVKSVQTSPHVTSFVEVDATNIVQWRERIKRDFQKQHGQKITYTPIFMDAIARAIRDFPMINISVQGSQIIIKHDINIGMATALPSGNLIVPVIRNADGYNLVGLTKAVNDLADRARSNKLKPEEIQDGTFTLTNVGTFGNVMGTPIINQPQVAIMAAGAIRKKPAVVETEYGDLIAVRHLMFLSLSYDHRVVDGFLGGSFLRRVGDYLEAFDPEQAI